MVAGLPLSFVAIRSALATSPDKGFAWAAAVIAGGGLVGAIAQIIYSAIGS
jgi:hypothetical protein